MKTYKLQFKMLIIMIATMYMLASWTLSVKAHLDVPTQTDTSMPLESTQVEEYTTENNETEAEAETEAETETQRFVYTFDKTNESIKIISDVYVRREPYNDADILTTAYKGTVWTRVGYNEFWSQILLNGEIVYAATKFMETINVSPTESATEVHTESTTESEESTEATSESIDGNEKLEETESSNDMKPNTDETVESIVDEDRNESTEGGYEFNTENKPDSTQESVEKNTTQPEQNNNNNSPGLKKASMVGVVLLIIIILLFAVSIKLYTMKPKKKKRK